MIVSWNWLREYVTIDAPIAEFLRRLTMAGLNIESQKPVDDDVAIDVEVTSNRPDCLGHIGIAREAAVLYDTKLTIPQPAPKASAAKTASVTSVAVECPDLCPRYTARVIRGIKLAASPQWLRKRLEAIGIPSINNIVDITNYVLMECGQPLHAFDLDRLEGRRISVRRASKGERITAINQRNYELDADMCVIADVMRPVAVAGVMGGFETEINSRTRNVLIEAAAFTPLSVRNTARKLGLHSDSSYRFERGTDPAQIGWASRRACQLILDLAGGELLDEPIVAGSPSERERPPIKLRFRRISKILGIDVAADEATRLLEAVGIEPQSRFAEDQRGFVPPSWRRDVTREIDLIEEVARLHGYDKIPQNAPVSLEPSAKTLRDRVAEMSRLVLTSAGFFEAVTLSFVSDEVCDLFQPRGPLTRVRVNHSSRRHENVLRQSLVPSLLVSRQVNERHGTFNAELFEIAKVYLAAAPEQPESQTEPTMIGLVTGRSFLDAKGIVEALAQRVNPRSTITVKPSLLAQFAEGRGAEINLNGKPWGWLGELGRPVGESMGLREPVTVGEFDLGLLESNADLIPLFKPLAQFPAVERDLNFVLDEAVTWEALESIVAGAGGGFLERIGFGGQYRGKQVDADKKSYVVTLSYRAPDRTLTAEEVDQRQQAVIDACASKLGARLR